MDINEKKELKIFATLRLGERENDSKRSEKGHAEGEQHKRLLTTESTKDFNRLIKEWHTKRRYNAAHREERKVERDLKKVTRQ